MPSTESETLAQQLLFLFKMIDAGLNTLDQKKETNENSHNHHHKPKKVTGYILFSKANRPNAIENLQAPGETHAKVKSTHVMKELGRMWTELEPLAKEQWNAKAKATLQSN